MRAPAARGEPAGERLGQPSLGPRLTAPFQCSPRIALLDLAFFPRILGMPLGRPRPSLGVTFSLDLCGVKATNGPPTSPPSTPIPSSFGANSGANYCLA